APNEFGASFVQSVQRIAFMQNRIKDNEWITEYVSTCFTDSAMVWYLGLDKDTRSSWEALRQALVQRYPPPKPSVQPKADPPARVKVGWIEVLRPEFGDSLGYLSQDPEGEILVDASPENALKLKMALHTDSRQKIYSMRMLDVPDTGFPFLGLRLVKFPEEDPDQVPSSRTIDLSWHNPAAVGCYCKPSDHLLEKLAPTLERWAKGKTRGRSAYATWDFVQTTESKPGPYYIRKAEEQDRKARVVSAVWTVINIMKDATELGLTWPKGDNRHGNGEQERAAQLSSKEWSRSNIATLQVISEIALDAVVHKGTAEGLHAHVYNFPRDVTRYLDEHHVVRLSRAHEISVELEEDKSWGEHSIGDAIWHSEDNIGSFGS
ncbi:hypothetical protein FRC01_006349, partial [Tulasnella sp. 417]